LVLISNLLALRLRHHSYCAGHGSQIDRRDNRVLADSAAQSAAPAPSNACSSGLTCGSMLDFSLSINRYRNLSHRLADEAVLPGVTDNPSDELKNSVEILSKVNITSINGTTLTVGHPAHLK